MAMRYQPSAPYQDRQNPYSRAAWGKNGFASGTEKRFCFCNETPFLLLFEMLAGMTRREIALVL